MGRLKFRDYVELLKLLRIDVYFLLGIFSFYMPSITINQLAQDKYCLNKYSANESICLNLESSGPEYESIRNKVIEDGTTLKMYTTILTTFPGVFLSFFLGYWMDTYPNHIRYLLAIGPFTMVIQNLVIIYQCVYFDIAPMSLLYAHIAPAFSGSLVILMTGAYTYITRKTPAKYRALRFAILELFLFVSIPLSTTVGGAVLAMKPWISNQPRNYIGVFIISAISAGAAGLWVTILLDDADHTNLEDEKNNKEAKGDTKNGEGQDENDKRQKIEVKVSDRRQKTTRLIILDIFNVRNVVSTFHTALKKRDHNGRFCLLITMISMAVCMIGYMGENAIGFQYAQRVYHWSAEYYSYMSAAIISLPAIVTVITPPVLIHKFHLHDAAIGILGSVSLVAAMFARGLVLSAPGFFLGVIFGSFVGLLPIANRSIISRIIRYNEIGQTYAVLSCIESAGPLLSSVFYSKIFNATIGNSPGTVYISAGFVVMFPASVMVWLYWTRNTWDLTLLGKAEPKPAQTDPVSDHDKTTDAEDIHQKATPLVENRVIYVRPENENALHVHIPSDEHDESDEDENGVIELASNSSEIVLGKVEIVIEKIDNDQ